MASLDDLLAYVQKNPTTYGKWLPKKPDLWELIKDQPGEKPAEKIYNLQNPGAWEKAQACKICGKGPLRFENGSYKTYCSNKCSAADQERNKRCTAGFHTAESKAKRAASMMAKYGTDSMVCLNRKSGVIQQACLDKYGVDNALKHKTMQGLREQAFMTKYGVDNPFKADVIKQKIKQILLERYGVDSPLKLVDWSQKHQSNAELELQQLVHNTGNQAIYNSRNIIPPYELDIYIPDLKLAIEFNGIYWHSERAGKDRLYHLNKTKLCEAQGIKLLHIFEDEWLLKRELVEARLRIQLKQAKRIFARSCVVIDVDNVDAVSFCEANHIQGSVNGSVRLGLEVNGELVALMTFMKSRFNKSYEWELLRYCSAQGVIVVGGASKLLSAFRKKHTGSIISYADRRWSTGGLYKTLGFKQLHETKPSYFYIKPNELVRMNRIQAQKHKLQELLGDTFDPQLSELENMTKAGYDRVFDCGTLAFGLEAAPELSQSLLQF